MRYAPALMSVALLALAAGCEPDTSKVTSKAVTPSAETKDAAKPAAPRPPTPPKENAKKEPPKKAEAPPATGAAGVWSSLEKTQDTCKSTYKWWFDYWPDGGMRAIACHLAGTPGLLEASGKVGAPRAIFDALSKASPVPIYAEPKGQPTWGDEEAHGAFARYNPEFVSWFVDNAIPATKDPALRAATQGSYDKYFKVQARVFDEAYRRIAERPKCFAKEKRAYMKAVKKGQKFDREKWTDWQADNYCEGVTWKTARYSKGRKELDPNLTRDALGFWIRRHEDGTAALWHKGLVRLRETYESR